MRCRGHARGSSCREDDGGFVCHRERARDVSCREDDGVLDCAAVVVFGNRRVGRAAESSAKVSSSRPESPAQLCDGDTHLGELALL